MYSNHKLRNMSTSELKSLLQKLGRGLRTRMHAFKESISDSDFKMTKKLEADYSAVKNVLTHKINTGQK